MPAKPNLEGWIRDKKRWWHISTQIDKYIQKKLYQACYWKLQLIHNIYPVCQTIGLRVKLGYPKVAGETFMAPILFQKLDILPLKSGIFLPPLEPERAYNSFNQ